jgi:hypothetical protein
LNRPPLSIITRLELRRSLWPVAVIVLGVLGYAAVLASRGGLVDFAVPRTAAERYLAHEPLYRTEDGHYQFKYFPAFAAVMVPFTWPPKPVAEALWFTLTVAMAWAFVRLAFRTLPEPRMAFVPLVWLTLLLNGKFLIKELGFGQFNLPLALLLQGSVMAGREGRGLLAGGLVGAGVFIKPYALVMVPWLLLTQGWRALPSFGLVLAAGLALPAVSYGWDGNLDLLHAWYRTVSDTTAPNLMGFENISFASFWARWLPGPVASELALASVVAALGAGVALVARRRSVAEPDYLEGAYFSLLIPLLSPQGWDYLLLLALPGHMCLIDRWRETPVGWRVVTSIGLFFTSFAVYDIMRRTLYFLLMGWGAQTVGAVLLAASIVRLRWKKLA